MGMSRAIGRVLMMSGVLVLGQLQPAAGQTAPSTYSAYTGTDSKPIPSAPLLGAVNTSINDPTFGSRILRVTDQNTLAGGSLISAEGGFFRTWNANSTAIKLQDAHGSAYWLEFNPATFKVGDGSSTPVLHQPPFDSRWIWSAVNADVIYAARYWSGQNGFTKYNKVDQTSTYLGAPSNGDRVPTEPVVVGMDKWVCAAAGLGQQNTYPEIFCLDPNNPSNTLLINVPAKTLNGVLSSDPNWPTTDTNPDPNTNTCDTGQTVIGIHSIDGSAGNAWLGVSFHCDDFGRGGNAVFNLTTRTWSLLRDQDHSGGDVYWGGHNTIGDGKFVNGSGSISGRDSRGAVTRNPDGLNPVLRHIMEPPALPNNGSCDPDVAPNYCWYDGEHSSWFNAATNPNAPVLFSRYSTQTRPSPLPAWSDEIIAAATDGSNTVWRFAHNHASPGEGAQFYNQGFAQISPDGRWALLASYWDGTLGDSNPGDFLPKRIDTFIVELSSTATASVAWTDIVNATAIGSTLTKTGGCSGCDDAGAISQQQIASGDGYVEFTIGEANTFWFGGLSHGTPGTSYAGVDFGFRFSSGAADIQENGVYKGGDTTYVAGDVFRVAIVNGQVQYKKNGVLLYTSAGAPIYPARLDAALGTLGATVHDAKISGQLSQ